MGTRRFTRAEKMVRQGTGFSEPAVKSKQAVKIKCAYLFTV